MSSSSFSTEAPAVAQAPAPAPAPAPGAGAQSSKSPVKKCKRCLEWFSSKNIADHRKVHALEDGGVRALHRCDKCNAVGSDCIVAEHPKDLTTYSCLCCLRAHKSCSFTSDAKGVYSKTKLKWAPVHPALELK
ncbi:hypothetical protein ACHAPJ_005679 [Fusarium lateritium]